MVVVENDFSVQLWPKGRVQKKKLVEFSTKGGGVSDGRFSTKKKNIGLKHWILHKDHFKTHLFFSIFGWEDPFQLGSRSEGWLKLQTSLEKPSDKCQKTHIIQNSFHDA